MLRIESVEVIAEKKIPAEAKCSPLQSGLFDLYHLFQNLIYINRIYSFCYDLVAERQQALDEQPFFSHVQR